MVIKPSKQEVLVQIIAEDFHLYALPLRAALRFKTYSLHLKICSSKTEPISIKSPLTAATEEADISSPKFM